MPTFKQKYPNWASWDRGAQSEYTLNTVKESWDKSLGLSKGEWLQFMRKVSRLICKEVATNPEGFELPNKMGLIQVAGYIGNPKDLRHSTDDKTVYYRNNHTGGYVYKCYYLYGKKRGMTGFSNMFKFRTSAPLRKMIHEQIKKDADLYYKFETAGDVFRMDISPQSITRW